MVYTLVAVFVLCFIHASEAYLSQKDLYDLDLDVHLRADLFKRPDATSQKPLLATVVRLAFHDCAGYARSQGLECVQICVKFTTLLQSDHK